MDSEKIFAIIGKMYAEISVLQGTIKYLTAKIKDMEEAKDNPTPETVDVTPVPTEEAKAE